jgi:GxxExxY protein
MTNESLNYDVIGCAMKVHRILGTGFIESVYQRCLEIEFKLAGIPYEKEKHLTVYYQNYDVGGMRADFVVAGKLILELKALSGLDPLHIFQVRNYLKAFNFDEGLLINFGSESLQIKKIFRNNEIKKNGE